MFHSVQSKRLAGLLLFSICGSAISTVPMHPLYAQRGSAAEPSRAEVDQTIATFDRIVKFAPRYSAFLSGNSNLDDAKKIVEDFRRDVGSQITPELIATANNTESRRLISLKARANRFAETFEGRLAGADLERASSHGSEGPIFMKYLELVIAREKLTMLHKIYGDTPEIASAIAASKITFAKVGDFDAVEDQAAETRRAYVAETRLPPGRRTDAALSREFGQAFLASPWTKSEHGTPQVLRVNLLSSGWSVERNELTGIILSRDQQAAIAFKTSAGKCFSAIALFEQKHQGGGRYGGTYYRSGSQREMLCENVP